MRLWQWAAALWLAAAPGLAEAEEAKAPPFDEGPQNESFTA